MYRISLLLMLALAAGCDRGGAKIGAPEALAVPVAPPVAEEVTEYVYYTGRANSRNSVVIQPRVTGFLMRMPFKEGADVKKDDVLFEIDARPYEEQFKAATAQVALNVATLKYAVSTNIRFKELRKKAESSVSERELEQYQAQEDQAIANLNIARANLESAKLNLAWTVIKSPIDGHVSRYYLTLGNLVNQDVTQLTTVVSMDPIHVYFDMDEPTLLRIKRAINEGTLRPRRKEDAPTQALGASMVGLCALPQGRPDLAASSALVPGRIGPEATVEIGLAGEDGFPHKGTINFVDNQVNAGTGSISVRGVFDNPKPVGGTHLIAPGMFVRVRLPIGQAKVELLVIDRAVTSDQGIKYVYALDAANKVQQRRVTVGSLQDDGLRVISQGLTKEDRVLVGGLQQVRPGMIVTPDPVSMPTLANPAIPKEKAKTKAKK